MYVAFDKGKKNYTTSIFSLNLKSNRTDHTLHLNDKIIN